MRLFCAWILLLACGCLALRASEPVDPDNKQLAGADATAVEAAPIPAASDDAIFTVIKKFHDQSDPGDNAAVVEVGSGPDLYSPAAAAKGKPAWLLPAEEPGPAPEVRPLEVRADDPESLLRNAADVGGGEIVNSQPAAMEMAHREAAPVETARFISGEGLDSETEERAAERYLQERQEAASKAVAEKAVSALGSGILLAEKTDKSSRPQTLLEQEKAQKQCAVSGDSEALKTPFTQPSQKPKKGDPSKDPEVRFKELLVQIEENKKRLHEKIEQSRAGEALKTAGDGETPLRDARAARLLDVLNSKQSPGVVSGRVIDAATKQPLPARIKITDCAETVARAVLPDGFWCPGAFKAPVIGGYARLEVSQGRFFPSYLKGFEVHPGSTVEPEVLVARSSELNFARSGWYLADLDLAVRSQKGEGAAWFGNPPAMRDLILAARGEGVQVLGVPAPLGDEAQLADFNAALAAEHPDLLLLPIFPGPRHVFHGTAMGLGVANGGGLREEIGAPESPLAEAFDNLHTRGGLAIFKSLAGTRDADIRREIFSLLPRLEKGTYFGSKTSGSARLYSANELPFDTVTGPLYDAFTFDGSNAAERIWFNLLNNGYTVSAVGAGGGSLEAGRIPFGQTFVHVDGKLTREAVLEGIKQGRTTISYGPAVFFRVLERDMGPGSTLAADGRALTLQIQAYASMIQGSQLDTIELLRNGEVAHVLHAAEGEAVVHDFRWAFSETTTAWYMVRVTERHVGAEGVRGTAKAWTSPIFFRGTAFSPPTPARTRISGMLRAGLTPVAGSVSVLTPGQPSRRVETDAGGRFSVELPASSSLIFEAPDCEPLSRRVFEHPKVQQALGAQQLARETPLLQRLGDPVVFDSWRLLLSELNWDVSLTPVQSSGAKSAERENP